MAGNRFVKVGTNPNFLAGGFSVWTGLQGSEDVGAAIAVYDVEMAALDSRNTQADQIVWVAIVVLWVIIGILTIQREVGTCCYQLHCLLGPQ